MRVTRLTNIGFLRLISVFACLSTFSLEAAEVCLPDSDTPEVLQRIFQPVTKPPSKKDPEKNPEKDPPQKLPPKKIPIKKPAPGKPSLPKPSKPVPAKPATVKPAVAKPALVPVAPVKPAAPAAVPVVAPVVTPPTPAAPLIVEPSQPEPVEPEDDFVGPPEQFIAPDPAALIEWQTANEAKFIRDLVTQNANDMLLLYRTRQEDQSFSEEGEKILNTLVDRYLNLSIDPAERTDRLSEEKDEAYELRLEVIRTKMRTPIIMAMTLLADYEHWDSPAYKDVKGVSEISVFQADQDPEMAKEFSLYGTMGQKDLRIALLGLVLTDPYEREKIEVMITSMAQFDEARRKIFSKEEFEKLRAEELKIVAKNGVLQKNSKVPTWRERVEFTATTFMAIGHLQLSADDEFFKDGEFSNEKLSNSLRRILNTTDLTTVSYADIKEALEMRPAFDDIRLSEQAYEPYKKSQFFNGATPAKQAEATAVLYGVMEPEFYKFNPSGYLRSLIPDGGLDDRQTMGVLLNILKPMPANIQEMFAALRESGRIEDKIVADLLEPGPSLENRILDAFINFKDPRPAPLKPSLTEFFKNQEIQRAKEEAFDRYSLKDLTHIHFIRQRITKFQPFKNFDENVTQFELHTSAELEVLANQLFEYHQLEGQILQPRPSVTFETVAEFKKAQAELVPVLKELAEQSQGVPLQRYGFGGSRPDLRKLWEGNREAVSLMDDYRSYFGAIEEVPQASPIRFADWRVFLDEAKSMREHLARMELELRKAMKNSWDIAAKEDFTRIKSQREAENKELEAALKKEETRGFQADFNYIAQLKTAFASNELIIEAEEVVLNKRLAKDFRNWRLPRLEQLSYFVGLSKDKTGYDWNTAFIADADSEGGSGIRSQRLIEWIDHFNPKRPTDVLDLSLAAQSLSRGDRRHRRLFFEKPEESLTRMPYRAMSKPVYLMSQEKVYDDLTDSLYERSAYARHFYRGVNISAPNFVFRFPARPWAEKEDFELFNQFKMRGAILDDDQRDAVLVDGSEMEVERIRKEFESNGRSLKPVELHLQNFIHAELVRVKALMLTVGADAIMDIEKVSKAITTAVFTEQFNYDAYLRIIAQRVDLMLYGTENKIEVEGSDLEKEVKKLLASSPSLRNHEGFLDFESFLSRAPSEREDVFWSDQLRILKKETAALPEYARQSWVLRYLRGSSNPEWVSRVQNRLVGYMKNEAARFMSRADTMGIPKNLQADVLESTPPQWREIRKKVPDEERAGLASIASDAQGANGILLRQAMIDQGAFLKSIFLEPNGKATDRKLDPGYVIRDIFLKAGASRPPRDIRLENDTRSGHMLELLRFVGLLNPEGQEKDYDREIVKLLNDDVYELALRKPLAHLAENVFTDGKEIYSYLDRNEGLTREQVREIISWTQKDPEFQKFFLDTRVTPTELEVDLDTEEFDQFKLYAGVRSKVGNFDSITWNNATKKHLGKLRRFLATARFLFAPDQKDPDISKREPQLVLASFLVAGSWVLDQNLLKTGELSELPASDVFLPYAQADLEEIEADKDGRKRRGFIDSEDKARIETIVDRLDALKKIYRGSEGLENFDFDSLKVATLLNKAHSAGELDIDQLWQDLGKFVENSKQGYYGLSIPGFQRMRKNLEAVTKADPVSMQRFYNFLLQTPEVEFMERANRAGKGVFYPIPPGLKKDGLPKDTYENFYRQAFPKWKMEEEARSRAIHYALDTEGVETGRIIGRRVESLNSLLLSIATQNALATNEDVKKRPLRAFSIDYSASTLDTKKFSRDLETAYREGGLDLNLFFSQVTQIMSLRLEAEKIRQLAIVSPEASQRIINQYREQIERELPEITNLALHTKDLSDSKKRVELLQKLFENEAKEAMTMLEKNLEQSPLKAHPDVAKILAILKDDKNFYGLQYFHLNPETQKIEKGVHPVLRSKLSSDLSAKVDQIGWSFDEEVRLRQQIVGEQHADWLVKQLGNLRTPWFKGIQALEEPYRYRPDLTEDTDVFRIGTRRLVEIAFLDKDSAQRTSDKDLHAEQKILLELYGSVYVDFLKRLETGDPKEYEKFKTKLRDLVDAAVMLKLSPAAEVKDTQLNRTELERIAKAHLDGIDFNTQLKPPVDLLPKEKVYYQDLINRTLGIPPSSDAYESDELTIERRKELAELFQTNSKQLTLTQTQGPVTKQAMYQIWLIEEFQRIADKYADKPQAISKSDLYEWLRFQSDQGLLKFDAPPNFWDQKTTEGNLREIFEVKVIPLLSFQKRVKDKDGETYDQARVRELKETYSDPVRAAQMNEIKEAFRRAKILAESEGARAQFKSLRKVFEESQSLMSSHLELAQRYSYDQNLKRAAMGAMQSIGQLTAASLEYDVPVRELTKGLAKVNVEDVRPIVENSEAILRELERKENLVFRIPLGMWNVTKFLGAMVGNAVGDVANFAIETPVLVVSYYSGAGLEAMGVIDESYFGEVMEWSSKDRPTWLGIGYSDWSPDLIDSNFMFFGNLGLNAASVYFPVARLARIGRAAETAIQAEMAISKAMLTSTANQAARTAAIETTPSLMTRLAGRVPIMGGAVASAGARGGKFLRWTRQPLPKVWTKERYLTPQPSRNLASRATSGAVKELAEQMDWRAARTWREMAAFEGKQLLYGAVVPGAVMTGISLPMSWAGGLPRDRHGDVDIGRMLEQAFFSFGENVATFSLFRGVSRGLELGAQRRASWDIARNSFARTNFIYDEVMAWNLYRMGGQGLMSMTEIYGGIIAGTRPYQILKDEDGNSIELDPSNPDHASAVQADKEDSARLASAWSMLVMVGAINAVSNRMGGQATDEQIIDQAARDLLHIMTTRGDVLTSTGAVTGHLTSFLKRLKSEGHLTRTAEVYARQYTGRALSKDDLARIEKIFDSAVERATRGVERLQGSTRMSDYHRGFWNESNQTLDVDRMAEDMANDPKWVNATQLERSTEFMRRLVDANGDNFFWVRKDGSAHSSQAAQMAQTARRQISDREAFDPRFTMLAPKSPESSLARIFTTINDLDDFISLNVFNPKKANAGGDIVKMVSADGVEIETRIGSLYRKEAINPQTGEAAYGYQIAGQENLMLRRYVNETDPEAASRLLIGLKGDGGKDIPFEIKYSGAGKRPVNAEVFDDAVVFNSGAGQMTLHFDGRVILRRGEKDLSESYRNIQEMLAREGDEVWERFGLQSGRPASLSDDFPTGPDRVAFFPYITRKEKRDGFAIIPRGYQARRFAVPYEIGGKKLWGYAETRQLSDDLMYTQFPDGRMRVRLKTKEDPNGAPSAATRDYEKEMRDTADFLENGPVRLPTDVDGPNGNLVVGDAYDPSRFTFDDFFEVNRLNREAKPKDIYTLDFPRPIDGASYQFPAGGKEVRLMDADRRTAILSTESDVVRIVVGPNDTPILARRLRLPAYAKMFEQSQGRILPQTELFGIQATNYLMRRDPELAALQATVPARQASFKNFKYWLNRLNIDENDSHFFKMHPEQQLSVIQTRYHTEIAKFPTTRNLTAVEWAKKGDIEFVYKNLVNLYKTHATHLPKSTMTVLEKVRATMSGRPTPPAPKKPN